MSISVPYGDGSLAPDSVRRLVSLIAKAALAVLALVCSARTRD